MVKYSTIFVDEAHNFIRREREGGVFLRDQTKAHNERDAEESQVEFANGAERNQSHQNSTG